MIAVYLDDISQITRNEGAPPAERKICLEAEAEGAVSDDDFNSAFIRLLMVYTEAKLLQETWLR